MCNNSYIFDITGYFSGAPLFWASVTLKTEIFGDNLDMIGS